MEFSNDRPIYRQISDICFSRILSGEWKPEGKVPSVRELAGELVVNSHTVLKAFDYLQGEGIIVARRGLGFFLAADARRRVLEAKKAEFFDTTLSGVFANMKMLGITIEEVVEHYKAASASENADDK